MAFKIKTLLVNLTSYIGFITILFVIYVSNYYFNEIINSTSLGLKQYKNASQAIITNTLSITLSILAIYYYYYAVLNAKNKLVQSNFKKQMIRIFSFFILALLIFSQFFYLTPAFDWGAILGIVENANYQAEYLKNYNNQVFVIEYLTFFKTFLYPLTFRWFFPLVIITISLSYFLMYLISLKKLTKQQARNVVLFAMLWLPIYWYAQVAYTDTLVIVWIMLFVYLGFEKDFKITKNNYKYGLMIIVATIALSIKIMAIIVIFAYLLVVIVSFENKKQLLISIFILGSSLFFTTIIRQSFEKVRNLDTSQNFITLHWINMGQEDQRTPGGYNNNNFKISYDMNKQGITKEKQNEYYKEQLKTKMETRGLNGQLSFLVKKLSFTWFDPYFNAQGELRQSDIEPQKSINQSFFDNDLVYLFAKTHQNIIYVSLLITAVSLRKSKITNLNLFTILVFLGIMTFLLIWETRSRYLVMFWPLLMTLTLMANHENVAKIIKKRRENGKKYSSSNR